MKTPFLFVSLVLFVFSTTTLNVGADPVLDIEGNELQRDVPYHILSVVRGGGGGGVTLAPRNGSCPFDVVQEPLDVLPGLLFSINPINTNEDVVHESNDVTIKFPVRTFYPSSVWRVENYNGKDIVTLGGVDESLRNSFKVEKIGEYNRYKFVYCLDLGLYCRDVGIFFDNKVRRLALTDVPFLVQFRTGVVQAISL